MRKLTNKPNPSRLKSLLIFFGPILLPKAIGWFRAARARSRANDLKVQPLPRAVAGSILLLAVVPLVLALLTLPVLSPENIFVVTQSRIQAPTDVLFTRLASLRPDHVLTAADQALRARFVNLESRLLYLQYGPDALAECPFCSSSEPRTYFYYALPELLLPHLANWVVIAIVTSSVVTGRYGAKWRYNATTAALGLAAVDMFWVGSYNHQRNGRVARLEGLDMFYWDTRLHRAVALAALDLLVGALLYLSSTHRAFADPPTPAERVEAVIRALAAAKGKVNAVGVVKNTANRDEELRGRTNAYWAHEVRLMRDVMEERDVIEGVNDALENRIDIGGISKDADVYARTVMGEL